MPGSKTFYAYLKESMDSMGLPAPASLFATMTTATGTAPLQQILALCALTVAVASCSDAGGTRLPVVASVRVTSPTASLEVGASAQLTATPTDASGNALANRPASWSTSSQAILTVSTSGLALGVSPGKATVTATVEGKPGSVELTVVAPPAIGLATSSVAFAATAGGASPQSQTVGVTNTGGGTLGGLTASVSHASGQPSGWLTASLSGASAPATLTLAATTGSLAAGTYNAAVSVSSSAKSVASATVAVQLSVTAAPPAPVATVVVTPENPSVIAGQTVQLTATMRDAGGNLLTGRTVEWASANSAVATVSAGGLVTGVAPGAVTITATSEGKPGTAQVTVTPVPVASVAVSPPTAGVLVGGTVQLTAAPKDAAGNALTGRAVSWTTSNAAIATVGQTGVVTGVAVGSATITATSEGKSGTAEISVTAPPSQIAAGSIVYIKAGNVWLSDASGAIRRQVTSDGRYRSPSMADDGTIGVLRDPEANTAVGTEFVRLSPGGAVLSRFTWTYSNTVHRAAISPDGLSFAHIYTSVCAYRTGGTRACLRLAFTPADRYEEVERTGTFDNWDYVWAAWQTNQRLVITGGYLASPVLTYSAAEIYVRPDGVVVAEAERDPYRLEDPDYKTYLAALTRDGTRMVTHRQRFRIDNGTEVLGPHEVAIYRHTGPRQYVAEGAVPTAGGPNAVTTSPDGKAWAFADGDGVWVHVFGTTEIRLLDPDGRQPSWGAFVLR